MGVYRTDLAKDNDIYVQDSSGSKRKVISSTGEVLVRSTASMGYYETLTGSSTGFSPSTMPSYGVSRLIQGTATASSGFFTVTLAAPITGVEKIIILDSTVAAQLRTNVKLNGAYLNDSTDAIASHYVVFSSLGSLSQSITLVGLSTDIWAVRSINSTLLFFNAATGIRDSTIAITSG